MSKEGQVVKQQPSLQLQAWFGRFWLVWLVRIKRQLRSAVLLTACVDVLFVLFSTEELAGVFLKAPALLCVVWSATKGLPPPPPPRRRPPSSSLGEILRMPLLWKI